jgi:ornithine decarboxylase
MRTGFNGFGQGDAVDVADEPMSSLYCGRRDPRVSDNVVSLR